MRPTFAAAAAGVMTLATSQAVAQPEGDRLAAIEARLADVEGQLAALQAERARAAPSATTPDGWQIDLGGYLQVDAVAFRASSEDELDPSTGAPLNEQRYFLRRGRLLAAASHEWFAGSLELDGNTIARATARVVGAEVVAGYPRAAWGADDPPLFGVRARLGLMRIPFGHELPEAAPQQLFQERTTGSLALFPGNRDLGVVLEARYHGAVLSLSMLNGVPSGDRQVEPRDPSASHDLLARVHTDLEPLRWLTLRAGTSGLWGRGFHPGTPQTKDVLVWRDVDENGLVDITEVQVIAGSAALASETFERFALAGHAVCDVAVPWAGRFRLFGEVAGGKNLDRGLFVADPIAMSRNLRELAWHVGFRQELSGYAEVGLRYDRYDPDVDATDQQARRIVPLDATLSTLAVAGAARWERVRLILQYDHRKNALGRTSAGEPTTRRDDAFTIRAEVRL